MRAVSAFTIAVLCVWSAGGCETYRVEYHPRPGYYRNAAMGELPDRVTLDDGTVVVFGEKPITGSTMRADEDARQPFQIREEQEDGTIILRALLPEHVLANTLTCLHNGEYELLWEQVVSQETKRAYEQRGEGVDEFSAFFRTHRAELAATLTRLLLGIPRREAVMENLGGGVIRFRLHPRVDEQFKFKTADVVSEPQGLRLLMIR